MKLALAADARRLPLTKDFVKDFCDSIDDTKEWKALATSHSYPDRNPRNTDSKIALVKFESSIVQHHLKHYLCSLNYWKRKEALQRATDSVTSAFDTIFGMGFHNVETFLSEEHLYDRMVMEHYKRTYSNGEHVLELDCVRGLDCIRNSDNFGALMGSDK
jgi:hypothetical protein